MSYQVPHNFTRPNGQTVSGYDRPENAWMWSEDGFVDVSDGVPATPIAPDPATFARVEALRQAYRDATHSFCQLANHDVVDKLEDVDYQACALAAYTANPVAAGMLADTLLYCLTSLRAYDGVDAWDRI